MTEPVDVKALAETVRRGLRMPGHIWPPDGCDFFRAEAALDALREHAEYATFLGLAQCRAERDEARDEAAKWKRAYDELWMAGLTEGVEYVYDSGGAGDRAAASSDWLEASEGRPRADAGTSSQSPQQLDDADIDAAVFVANMDAPSVRPEPRIDLSAVSVAHPVRRKRCLSCVALLAEVDRLSDENARLRGEA